MQGGRNDPFEIPSDLPVPYVVVPYLSDMNLGYAAADLMLCRGGAITVATLFACLGVYNLYRSFDNQTKAAEFDQSEGRERLQAQAEGLTRYAIVDAAKNVYQVPISDAMQSVVTEYEKPLER